MDQIVPNQRIRGFNPAPYSPSVSFPSPAVWSHRPLPPPGNKERKEAAATKTTTLLASGPRRAAAKEATTGCNDGRGLLCSSFRQSKQVAGGGLFAPLPSNWFPYDFSSNPRSCRAPLSPMAKHGSGSSPLCYSSLSPPRSNRCLIF